MELQRAQAEDTPDSDRAYHLLRASGLFEAVVDRARRAFGECPVPYDDDVCYYCCWQRDCLRDSEADIRADEEAPDCYGLGDATGACDHCDFNGPCADEISAKDIAPGLADLGIVSENLVPGCPDQDPCQKATAEDWPTITSTINVHGPDGPVSITERQGRYRPNSKLGDLLANLAELTMDHPLLPGDRLRVVLEKGEDEGGASPDETYKEAFYPPLPQSHGGCTCGACEGQYHSASCGVYVYRAPGFVEPLADPAAMIRPRPGEEG
jgi:hypothetical protein